VGKDGAKSLRIVNESRSAWLTVRSPLPEPPFFGGGSLLVAPRRSGKLTFRFSPTAVGPFTHTVELATSDPAAPILAVELGGEGK
jgi:hypothetical protein